MKYWEKKGKILVCAALLAAFAGTARADEYHYNTTIIGERPAGMGGAYTAVSDDASGLFHNPAGTVFSFGSNLSVSANAVNIIDKKYDNAGLNFAYERRSQTVQPNFFGVVQHTPFGTIGFSYTVPDSMTEEQNQTFPNPTSTVAEWTLNYLKEYNVYNIGPSIALDISKDLKIGATLYFHYKKSRIINNSYQLYANGTYRWLNMTYNQQEMGYHPIIGILYSPENGKYAVGLTFSSTSILESTNYGQCAEKSAAALAYNNCSSENVYANNAWTNPVNYTTNPAFARATSSEKANYPYTTKFGLALFPSSALLIAADLSYISAATGTSGEDYQPVINGALGLEYYLSSSYAIRAGLFSDRSNTRPVSNKSDADHVDLYGISFSGSYFVKGSAVTLGFTESYGSGQQWINSAAQSSGTMTMNSFMVFLGSSYSY